MFTSTPTQAQSTSACRTAIDAVEQRMEENGRVQVAYADYRDMSDAYQTLPEGRSYEYAFGLDGQGASDILNSPVMAADMAGEIFENCGEVGIVAFGLYQTSIAHVLGWSPDGKWTEFECQEDDYSTERTPWGQKFCG
ncbi:MAG: hypothetical protein AAFY72_03035 [Cyanobacteria bacterium J06649_4]